MAVPRAAGAEDRDRSLDTGGRDQAEAAGRWLADQGFAPDTVLVSPTRRTRETWDQIAPRFPAARLQIENALYDAMPEEILERVEHQAGGAETLMVIAHNPGLQELAQMMLADTGGADFEVVSRAFPTASAAVINLADPAKPRLEARFDPSHGRPRASAD